MNHTARQEWKRFSTLAPSVNAALLALSRAIQDSGLDLQLVELIKLRASQINGCAFCVQYHTIAARKLDIEGDRLSLLPVWRDAQVYTNRERAALQWTEVLTRITAQGGVPDDDYAVASTNFSDVELAHLTSAVSLINAWNRIAEAYRFTPSSSN